MPFSRFSGLTSALTPFPTPPPQRPSSPHSASVFVRVRPWAVPCTTPAPSRPSSIPLALTSFPEPFPPPTPAVRRTWSRGFLLSLGRGCCAKIKVSALPLPPPSSTLPGPSSPACVPSTFNLKPPIGPCTTSASPQGPSLLALPVPAVRRTWCRGFLLPLGRGFHAKIRRLFFEDGALKPTLAGLMSASGRQRRARLKKRPLVFAPPQCKRNPLPPSPPIAPAPHPPPHSHPRHHLPATAQQTGLHPRASSRMLGFVFPGG